MKAARIMEEDSSTPLSEQNIVSGKKHLSPLKALRWRDFRLLWIGQSLSSLGNTFQAVALAWMVLSIHGSAVDLGLTLLALAIPQAALTLTGGILIDRLDARFVMILADSLRIVTASALALVAGNAGFHLWLVWMILLVHGTGNALFAPAASSLTPRLVETEDLESANALSTAMTQIGPLIGFLAAGFLIRDFGVVSAFVLNAFSYAIAVFMALLMRPLKRTPYDQRTVLWHDIREVAHYLRTAPWLITLFLMDVLVAFSAIATNSIGAPMLAKTMHAGTQGYGLLAGSYYGGGVLGLLLSAWYPLRSRRGMICIICQGTEALLMAMIAFTPLLLVLCCMATWSAFNGLLVVLTLSLIQQRVPSNMTGRIMAFWMLASTGVLPLAQMAGGIIANAVGAQALFALAGCIVLFGAILGGSVPALRQLN